MASTPAMTSSTTQTTSSTTQAPGLNLIGFLLASIGVIFLSEVAPPFGVGVMTLILLYEGMTHTQNWTTLANYLKGSA